MYIGTYGSYATTTPLDKYKQCINAAPWYDIFKHNRCSLAQTPEVIQKTAVEPAGKAINEGIQNLGQQLGVGIGANAGTITPALTMLGIAAVGIIAVIMVIR